MPSVLQAASSSRPVVLLVFLPNGLRPIQTRHGGRIVPKSSRPRTCMHCAPDPPVTRKRKREDAKASRGLTAGRHAIVAAFSCDGIHFSKFRDVSNAGDAGAGRTFHQPVDGLVVEKGRVYVYVQENVRGLDMDRYDDDPLYPTGPPRVVRYGTTVVALARRAFEETRGLAGC